MRILMLGNSFTFVNDMPAMLAGLTGAEVVHHTRGGARLAEQLNPKTKMGAKTLEALEKERWDYVVLQEHAHPFGPEEEFLNSATALNKMIREAGSTPVIYECWAKKDEPELQDHMNQVHRHVAEEIGALIAPVGENWWTYKKSWPNLEMYDADGAHASCAGSDFAAKLIWETILDDLHRKEMNDNA